MSKFPSVLDKPLTRPKTEVPLSTFALLFSEIVQYQRKSADTIQDIENGYVYYLTASGLLGVLGAQPELLLSHPFFACGSTGCIVWGTILAVARLS
jgi:hypothetical protein